MKSRPASLRYQWRLVLAAFVLGGIFEVVDNLLGLRTLNFESSAPAILKVAKELSIMWLLWCAKGEYKSARLDWLGVIMVLGLIAAFYPQVFAIPGQIHALVGLLYFAGSIAMLLLACAVYRPQMQHEFAGNFLYPALSITLATQLLEAYFAPSSLYFESNLLGLDRRAGLAAIPTTAGLLGVAGFHLLRGHARLISVLVIAMANSTLSLLCLLLVIVAMARRRPYVVLLLPFIGGGLAFLIADRAGLDTSVTSRMDILGESLREFAWLGPSSAGALATAKSVALAPFDSLIVDSLYLEAWHVMGVIPGSFMLLLVFIVVYLRAGALALGTLATAGVGYLVLEAWPVWLSIIMALAAGPRRHPSPTAPRQSSPPPTIAPVAS